MCYCVGDAKNLQVVILAVKDGMRTVDMQVVPENKIKKEREKNY